MDNIGPVNRSERLPAGWRFEQSDATSWMATYALHLMRMALELARHDEAEFLSRTDRMVPLGAAARELSRRLAALFVPGPDGRRPADGKRIEGEREPAVERARHVQ